jgi:hypothetical protein
MVETLAFFLLYPHPGETGLLCASSVVRRGFEKSVGKQCLLELKGSK